MTIRDRLDDFGLRVHQFVYEKSDGRLGHQMIGVPSLLLRTVGRRSGRTRTAALVYASDGGNFVVVASNGGSDRPPAWLLNIEANPQVEIQLGRRRQLANARVVRPDDPDFPRLWDLVNANNHGRYRGYQAKTERPILLVVVAPAVSAAGRAPGRVGS